MNQNGCIISFRCLIRSSREFSAALSVRQDIQVGEYCSQVALDTNERSIVLLTNTRTIEGLRINQLLGAGLGRARAQLSFLSISMIHKEFSISQG